MEHQARSSVFHSKMTLKRKTAYQSRRTVKSRIAPTIMDKLDDNLLGEILTRLPAKTVAQLKVINKRWYSLISDPFFVAKHTGRQSNRDAFSFFSNSIVVGSIVRLSFDRSSPTLVSETISLGLAGDFEKTSVDISACCHGLLLVTLYNYFSDNPLCIINPMTKKKQHIPYPDLGEQGFWLGLAVGPMASPYYYNHYNVVCLFQSRKAFHFKIFSSETGYWRDSKETTMISYGDDLKETSIDILSKPAYFRGTLHWLTSKEDIIAFDADKENSWIIEIPKSITKMVTKYIPWLRCSWLGVVEDEVNLVVVNEDEIVNWVLHDYENKKWKIKRRLKRIGRIYKVSPQPMFFDGERLLLLVPIICQGGGLKFHWQLNNIRTAIAGPLCATLHTGCFPAIATLIGL